MKLRSIVAGLAWTVLNIMPAAAADPVRFALCYDLSKAYTFVTPQVAQAARDYADLLNSKGGIEGPSNRNHCAGPWQRAAARHRML